MNWNDVTGYLFDAIPYRKKSAFDWILPASVGLGLGVAAGVGIGMLVAPAPGDETRAKLREQAYRLKDKAMEAAQQAKSQITQKANGLAGEIERRGYEL